MAGDNGSEELIAGALQAAQEVDVKVSLVGDEGLLREQLDRLASSSSAGDAISIVHASQVIEMSENPVNAIRGKKDASVMVAFDLVRKGEADAVVSAGNSGATMAAGVRKLGRLAGVSRPGIASLLPTKKKPVILMDIGANVDCRPRHLLQFAVMASAYSRVRDIPRPTVGLLSIGEESGKGNSLVKEAFPLLENSSLNFIGNVEGRDVFQGDVDVIVCDGFVGNVCLKISEGLADALMKMLKDEIVKSLPAKLGYLLALPAFKAFKKRVDYAEYGGAPLLGLDGIGLICHGKSSSHAIKNAIIGASKMVKLNINQDIMHSLGEIKTEEQAEA
jgi:glycerol-3-phosphate acyltransferase PlsX